MGNMHTDVRIQRSNLIFCYLTLVSWSHSAIILICGGPLPDPQDMSALREVRTIQDETSKLRDTVTIIFVLRSHVPKTNRHQKTNRQENPNL